MERSESVVEKAFAPGELTDLLIRAAQALVDRCRTEYCEPPPPSTFRFVMASAQASRPLLAPAEVVREILAPDGSFRAWINLSPVAVTTDDTVLEVDRADRFTRRLIVGPLAFPFEPFHLLGPSLPAEWVEGTPPPKVSLPTFGERAG